MLSNSLKLCVLFISISMLASCSNSSKVIYQTAKSQKAHFEGKVVDEESREAIPNAKVWVEGTTINTKTDEQGVYSIALPKGYFEIFAEAEDYDYDKFRVSVEGVAGKVHDFFLTKKISQGSYSYSSSDNMNLYDTDSLTESVKIRYLEAKIDSLEEIITELEYRFLGNSNTIKGQKVKTFTKQYINNNELNCTLTNPEDIVFAESEEDILWINNPVELVVLNYELGYKITIHLNEFASQKYSQIVGLNVDADYFFEEMKPKNKEQAKRWEEKRNYYFKGSLRHFLIAMASDKSPRYFGYRLYSGQFVSSSTAMAYSSSSVNDVEKQKYELFLPNNLNGNTILKLGDELRVEYVEKGVEDPDNIMGLNLYKYQTSWLSLNGDYIEFTNSGMFTTPFQVEVKGVWRYTPVCKMVPKDYLPPVES